MNNFFIKIHRDKVKVDKRVFVSLLDVALVGDYVSYKNAIKDNEISIAELKELAGRAEVPYPLFFSPKNRVDTQIKDNDKSVEDKFVTKHEMQVGYRGFMKNGDLALIIKDIAKKQEFLKKQVLTSEPDNAYIGFLSKKLKSGSPKEEIAETLRNYFQIDLDYMRKLNKKNIIKYLCEKIERKNIFVSTSSYRYMPQEIDKKLRISGFCIKDKKFPFIFINNRDGDEKPIILETEGRQIFTIISMLVCIGMGKFILNSNKGKMKDPSFGLVYGVTAEVLIPEKDITGMSIANLDEVRELANLFKVTPSMAVYRLRELRIISPKEANLYSEQLKKDIATIESKPKRTPTLITGYSKYNGIRFSREIVSAYNNKKITAEHARHILFRKNKMNKNLLQSYVEKFK